tara:strand:+ start:199 stop:462 length:264 start_codon:yes stop_codon:yes gene_type:complete
MNRRKSKLIKKKAHELMYEWLHTLVSEEDAKDITKENYKDFFPTLEKYIYHERNLKLSSFTERWFIQNIKKKSKLMNLNDIELRDIV